ncbi:MAG: hypothetical protein HOW97_05890 [Catenulispora sp.]|nr:hypothetical protein [Catenulispora sp.]NUR60030.1 hypothetical protein [Catenulispora sp.]
MAQTDEFAEALLARVADARLRLAEAAATADSHAVAEALDELEDALGLARESGVEVPPIQRDGTEQ